MPHSPESIDQSLGTSKKIRNWIIGVGGALMIIGCIVFGIQKTQSWTKEGGAEKASFRTAAVMNFPVCSDAQNIYFAEGETEKTISVQPGCWTGWVITPEKFSDVHIYPSADVVIHTNSGRKFIDGPARLNELSPSEKRFRFAGMKNAVVVKIKANNRIL